MTSRKNKFALMRPNLFLTLRYRAGLSIRFRHSRRIAGFSTQNKYAKYAFQLLASLVGACQNRISRNDLLRIRFLNRTGRNFDDASFEEMEPYYVAAIMGSEPLKPISDDRYEAMLALRKRRGKFWLGLGVVTLAIGLVVLLLKKNGEVLAALM